MTMWNNLKQWAVKKPSDGDQRRDSSVIEGGRRKGESENPYLTARRTWNLHVGQVVAERNTWQMIGILSLLIVLAAVGGVIYIGSQSKFIPFIVEVDKLGRPYPVGTVTQGAKVDTRILRSTVAEFISDARLVTPDIALQRKSIFNVYAKINNADPAFNKMNEFMNSTPESSPFKRAENEMVSIEIETALPQTQDTWQVEWIETTRDRLGAPTKKPEKMRALITIYVAEPSPQTTNEQMLKNPLNIYVRDFSWSRL